MALRLVMQRETEQYGRAGALRRGGKRGLLLLMIGFLWYQPGRDLPSWSELTATPVGPLLRDLFLTNVFQALTHIGAVTLWVLPGMAKAVILVPKTVRKTHGPGEVFRKATIPA